MAMGLFASPALFLAQSSSSSGAASSGVSIVGLLIGFVVLLAISCLLSGLMFFRILEKGHQPGWAAFVPVYNAALLFKMSGKSPFLALLFLAAPIPLVGGICGLIASVLLGMAVGKAFGKDTGFIVGLVLLGIVFYPILGFGKSQYVLGGAAQPQGFPVMPPTT